MESVRHSNCTESTWKLQSDDARNLWSEGRHNENCKTGNSVQANAALCLLLNPSTQKTLCNYCCIHWMSWLVPKTLLAPIQWSQIHRRSNIKVQLVDRSGSTKVYNFIWLSSLFLVSLLSPVLYPPFSIRPLKHSNPTPPPRRQHQVLYKEYCVQCPYVTGVTLLETGAK